MIKTKPKNQVWLLSIGQLFCVLYFFDKEYNFKINLQFKLTLIVGKFIL